MLLPEREMAALRAVTSAPCVSKHGLVLLRPHDRAGKRQRPAQGRPSAAERRRSAVLEVGLALLDEGGHAFFLVFQRKGGVEYPALEQQALA